MTFRNALGLLIIGVTMFLTSCQDDALSPNQTKIETTEFSQRKRTCLSTEHTHDLLKDPSYRQEHEQRLAAFEKNKSSHALKAGCASPSVIPVAVHYQGVSGTDASCLTQMAQRQINILNADFAGTNSDINKWQDAKSTFPGINNGEMCVKFVLADQNHPSGYGLSNGQPAVTVNRTQGDQVNQWAGYLNIFVQSGTGVLGYAPLGGSGNGDGVVIDYVGWSTGSCGSVAPEAPYVLGRTTTHEVGHYLLLDHIWGNGCSQDDEVADTPDQASDNSGCPTLGASSCGSADLHMNYMDYTNDACMYMFSAGQVARMTNYMNANLTNLTSNASNVYSGNTGGNGSGSGGDGDGSGGGTVTCDTPGSLSVSSKSATSISVSWLAEDDASSYRVRYRPTGGSYQTVTANSTSKTINNLTSGTTYEIGVRSICGDVNSSYSSNISVTTDEDASAAICESPTDETIEIIDPSTVTVSWTDQDDAIRYRIRYRIQGTSRWTAKNTTNPSITLSNLEPQVYEYQLRTRCSDAWTRFAARRTFDLTDDSDTGGGSTNGSYMISLTLDDYGSETTWALYNEDNDLINQAGPFADGAAGRVIDRTVELSAGCYEIDLYDAYGDGICCDYGDGKLEIKDPSGTTVASSDGNFGTYELIQFCVDAGRLQIIKQDKDAKRLSRGSKKTK